MRIISGFAKGLKLSSPPRSGQSIRPTSDRNREALFSVIHNRVRGALVLDLCAGTGALGLEALSRGAHGAVFVDKSPLAIKLIKANVNILQRCLSTDSSTALPPVKVIQKDLSRSLLFLTKITNHLFPQFNIIFLDPPYSKGLAEQTLIHLNEVNILADGGLLIVEESTKVVLPRQLSSLSVTDNRQYGDSTFWLYERRK